MSDKLHEVLADSVSRSIGRIIEGEDLEKWLNRRLLAIRQQRSVLTDHRVLNRPTYGFETAERLDTINGGGCAGIDCGDAANDEWGFEDYHGANTVGGATTASATATSATNQECLPATWVGDLCQSLLSEGKSASDLKEVHGGSLGDLMSRGLSTIGSFFDSRSKAGGGGTHNWEVPTQLALVVVGVLLPLKWGTLRLWQIAVHTATCW